MRSIKTFESLISALLVEKGRGESDIGPTPTLRMEKSGEYSELAKKTLIFPLKVEDAT